MTKQKFLIFLDIDGTLIKEDQRPNTKRLPAVIKKLEGKGFVFGLNSNRSYEDIVSVYTEFGLNGPIVLENGVYFKKHISGKKIFLSDVRTKMHADLMRATKEFITLEKSHAHVESMDTVAAISSSKKEKGVLIMINKFRLFTGSIHVYKDGVRDRELASKLASHLKKYFKEAGKGMEVVVTGVFGNIIVYPKGTTKQTSFQRLRLFYPDHTFAMIGDDVADAGTLNEVDHFFAVSNAVDEAKKVASYVAKESHTKGVIDILMHMEKTHIIQ